MSVLLSISFEVVAMEINQITDYLSSNTQFIPENIKQIGGGASAVVYKAQLKNAPFAVAVKCSKYPQLLQKEYEQISFISGRVDCRLPKIYHFGTDDHSNAFLVMQYFNGVGGDKLHIPRRYREALADAVTDNLLKLHTVHNAKFGSVDNAVYDTWYAYYSSFAQDIYDFACNSYRAGHIRKKVFKAVEASFRNLDKILYDACGMPTLIHGDYWLPNLLIDPDTYRLVGVVDPFNIMWAEPEYELFCLSACGRKLKLYENYKAKIVPTVFCDMKTEMYALYNELLWHKKLGNFNNQYLLYRSVRLLRQMKRNGIL